MIYIYNYIPQPKMHCKDFFLRSQNYVVIYGCHFDCFSYNYYNRGNYYNSDNNIDHTR